ncbi:uncharacterized protein GJ701_009881 isoform 2-T2 [Geothlypis trichas]
MNRGTEDKKSLEAAKLLDQMLSDLERRREMKRKAVLKAAFPGGSSGSLAVSAAGREVMPSTGTGDESAGMALPAAGMEDGLKPLGASAEMEGEAVLKAQFPGGSRGSLAASAAGREAMPGTVPGGSAGGMNRGTEDKKSLEAAKLLDQMLSDLERRREMLGKSDTNGQNPRNTPRIICPQDVRRSCMIGTVVTLFTVPISMVLCYVGFRWWKGKKRRAAAAPASRPRRRASPSPPESPETVAFDSSHMWPRHQQLPKKAEHQPSLPPPRPPSPGREAEAFRDPPTSSPPEPACPGPARTATGPATQGLGHQQLGHLLSSAISTCYLWATARVSFHTLGPPTGWLKILPMPFLILYHFDFHTVGSWLHLLNTLLALHVLPCLPREKNKKILQFRFHF